MRSRTPRTLTTALCGALVAVTALAACAPPPEEAPTATEAPGPVVEATGPGGQAPTFTYPVPLDLDEPFTEVLWEGDGDPLVDGAPVLVRIYSEDGRDASVLRDDFASVPQSYLLAPEAIGSDLYATLSGATVGSRILHVVETDDVPLVMSIDVLPTRAVGEPVSPGDGLPSVSHGPDGSPTVTIPAEVPAPANAVVHQIIRGTGDQVVAGQQVVIRYVAVKWSTGEVIDTTWGADLLPETVTIGLDQLIEGVEDGLEGLFVGSQVMLVVPPGQAFGPSGNELSTETLVYVVDILGTSPVPPPA
ncbi:FKBP-type peptidyl-prolyl cis-trans isomerase [Sanguibacter suaedae]|uniref:Peptidyl-prolyl cis-trans isomerase n=1 Tax=Sanguibacter suaedae TaxID=2795737 RepID=A0A934M9R1_9MICO|nr:FKBP-type peptidyl-prolyl cis-trans isomerase [Sanguibacter suaedae]MBI9114943.1 FKBP-type peptidyl-prolyl cis-trans isomerase [Sanguibacter suaedae]